MRTRTALRKLGKLLAAVVLALIGLLALVALVIGVAYLRANVTNGQIESSGQERRYLLFVPTTYNAAEPTPLVISLHGFVGWPANQMEMTRWNEVAEEHGFLVVYPEGTGFPRRWRAGGWGDASDDLMVDVVFISDLIDELAREYNVDPARVYANGISNGGGMSFLLGCALSDKIAAIGSVAGAYTYPLDECRPSRPVPMIAFHGTADQIVPYQGGAASDGETRLPVIPVWIAARAALDGCDPSPSELPATGAASGILYSGCTEDADVAFYTIDGGGHTWPGGEPLPEWITGYTSPDIDATHVMWEFFGRFSIKQ